MRTSGTNRRLRVLLTAIRNGTLLPRPEFQRRLVWSNRHKNAFIETVLLGYPFPEIYIAAGTVNRETGEGIEMLVDGQQRITTLNQYFTGSADLRLARAIRPYSDLSDEEKLAFLEYEVVVRDLGNKTIEEIIEIFQRINSTNYALNTMEIHNARFDGEFKQFGEQLAQDPFFESNHVFYTTEVRRMSDIRFVLTFVVTIMSTYFNRDSELELYLDQYNDEFPMRDDIERQIHSLFQFINACALGSDSRAWKKADLLTLLVETHRTTVRNRVPLIPTDVSQRLQRFYQLVDNVPTNSPLTSDDNTNNDIVAYHTAVAQANNDRASRIRRGEVLQRVLNNQIVLG